MRTIITIQKMKFINLKSAVEKSILAPRTFRNLLSPGHKNLVKIAGVYFLPLNNLSPVLQNRAAHVEQEEMKEQVTPHLDQSAIKELEFILLFSLTNERLWRQHFTRFQQPYLLNDQCETLCKTNSFIDAQQGLHKEGYSLKALFQAYLNVKDQLSVSNFSCSSYEYFTRKLNHMHINGIERSIVIAKKSATRLKQTSEPQKKLAIEYKTSLKRKSYTDILKKVSNKVMEPKVNWKSSSTVKALIRNPEIQTMNKSSDIGKKERGYVGKGARFFIEEISVDPNHLSEYHNSYLESVSNKEESSLVQNDLSGDLTKASYRSCLRRKKLQGKILSLFYSCQQNCDYEGLQLSISGIASHSLVDDIFYYSRRKVLTFLKRQLQERLYSLTEAYDSFRCVFNEVEYGFPDYHKIISSEYTFAVFIYQHDQNPKNIL